MKRPLTRALVKIIATGFYRQHLGFLLALFVVLFLNVLYTPVLNQTHLTPEQILVTALKLVVSSVSEPLGVGLLGGLFLLYSWKSWQYVARHLQGADVQFLYYSSNALPWSRQVQSWTLVQLVVCLPLVMISLYAMFVGVAFGYWLIPFLLPVYMLALLIGSGVYYTRLLNNTTAAEPFQADRLAWLRRWPKPLFSLFLYELLDKKRLPYTVTKALSLSSIALLWSVFPASRLDPRLFEFLGLCSALTHAVLLFQAREFEKFYLQFTRNFPHSCWQIAGQQVALYSMLLLPELLGLLMIGPFQHGLLGAALLLSVTLFFRALLARPGLRLPTYLRVVFGCFLVFLFVLLFGFTQWLIIVNLVAAGGLFYHYKYTN
ncbi:hypothetical protein [Hymenobacter norwichensis]|uniref:hypothetical protein n=1 Tax=Hymenobacter norwichensis TaxID=223903 RepID=UPI0003FA592B|nr:hypothetical protein [Hymenobacter norwichensis]